MSFAYSRHFQLSRENDRGWFTVAEPWVTRAGAYRREMSGYQVNFWANEDSAAFSGPHRLVLLHPSATKNLWPGESVWRLVDIHTGAALVKHKHMKVVWNAFCKATDGERWKVYRLLIALRIHREALRLGYPATDTIQSMAAMGKLLGLTAEDSSKTIKQKGITL